MSEFCKCGSLMLSGNCTNKNCTFRTISKPSSPKQSSRSKAASSDISAKEKKPPRVRRASKCITYNLYDINNEEAME
ncbi:MAG TPA: hypothetical protein VIO64_15320 [Pseudobacteroides sp.]|uniref:hypothetical protein n=1 Tax=Pseudobacteroides sp. TaxID=1968840 RepID=UPI002F9221D5